MPTPPDRPAQDWRVLVAAFWITSMVEGLGVSQVFALLPADLTSMGVGLEDRLAFVGIFSALMFLVGMPLVPLWGVWADKYSRKAVIARSALVEAVVFAAIALSREPWQLGASMLLVGFQLGNTGVMLAAIRDVAPVRRLGTVIGVFGAAGPVGFAAGPTLAGIFIDGFHWSIPAVFAVSSALSVGTAVLVAVGTREVRPEVVPVGRTLDLAFGAMRGVLADPVVRRIFAIFGVSFIATQMSRPYIPILVEQVVGSGHGLASSIALVAGAAALIGGLAAPLGGALGDRIGFRPVLIAALFVSGVALLVMPTAPILGALALLSVALAAATATVSAMVFGLLASEVPADRRSQVLNLVYLPLYAGGIVGPLVGAGVSQVGGDGAPFIVGGVLVVAGAVVIWLRDRSAAPTAPQTRSSRSSVPGGG